MILKKKLILAGVIIIPLLLISCLKKDLNISKVEDKEEDIVLDAPEILPEAVIKIKGYGEIKAELYPHKAPNTVNNFIELSQKDFYDGLTIHRIVKDFVVQGGCPKGDGSGDPGYEIKGEFEVNGFTSNDIKHNKGVLSMARGRAYDTAGSQFFIMTGDAQHLDKNYAGFGMVTEGIEVVDKLNNISVNGEVPNEKVIIEDISINLNGYEAREIKKAK